MEPLEVILCKLRVLDQAVTLLGDQLIRSGEDGRLAELQSRVEQLHQSVLRVEKEREKRAQLIERAKRLREVLNEVRAKQQYVHDNRESIEHMLEQQRNETQDVHRSSFLEPSHMLTASSHSPQEPSATHRPPTQDGRLIAHISSGECDQVPGYMMGRLKQQEINAFVDQINSVLKFKKNLMSKKRETVKNQLELKMYQEWHKDQKELPGERFFTADDFVVVKNIKFSKKDYSMLTVLRHVKRLKETRKGRKIFFVVKT